MSANEARIRIGIDGVNDVRNALRQLKSEFGGITGTIQGIGSGFLRLGADVAKAATGLKAIDFGAAADRYKQIDDQITRLAIRSGKNVDELKTKFKDFGRQAGVGTGEFANAAKAFDRATFSGIDDAAEAMRSLGAYAEDTDRSLEDMVELGADLYTKIGVPASRVEIELRKIQTIASNTSLASGFLGLEDSLRRILPIAAKLQGGPTRAAATIATIQTMGYGKQASEEIFSRIFGPLTEEREVLLRQAMKSAGFKGDPVVALASGPNKGLPVPSKGGLKALQKYLGQKNLLGTGEYMGGGLIGTEAARVFRRLDFNKVDLEEDRAVLAEDIREKQKEDARRASEEGEAFSRKGAQHRKGEGMDYGKYLGPGRTLSKYSGTDAGMRQRRERARAEIETQVGKVLTQSQDRVQSGMSPTTSAAVGTVNAYMPSVVQDAVNTGVAAAGNSTEIAGAIRGLAGAVESLPAKIQAGVQKGVESAKPPPRVGLGDIFPQKQAAKVN